MQLTLDIPEKPLFKDQDGGLVIPQEPLVNVLRKFDGVSFSDVLAMQQQSKETDANSGHDDVANNSIEKEELLKHCLDFITTTLPNLLLDKYDLVANITHNVPADVGREGTQRDPLEEGSYRCHVSHKATGQWYEMQDLNVTETMPQLIGVSESLLLVFERKSAAVWE
jgi:U4/U6.U5 tri-snRNP-associated protein 2